MPRRRWRHRRRSSGVNEYSTVSSSANSWVDFDGLSEAALASRSAVTIARLLRASGCGIFAAAAVPRSSNVDYVRLATLVGLASNPPLEERREAK